MTIVLPGFRYCRPHSVAEAVAVFSEADEAMFISGGHTLLPAMKAGLTAAGSLVDLRGLPELHGIVAGDGVLSIGAATSHAEVASSPVVRNAIPVLAALAGSIGDVQVRNRGTIGGSVANNDPAADYPAAVLALGAIVETDQRSISADTYFTGLYETALQPGEIVTRLHFPLPGSAGYAKFRNPASRYAMAATFVARLKDGSVRVAVTGAGNDGVFRWAVVEEALERHFAPEAVTDLEIDASTMVGDIHGSASYRANLVRVMTRRALQNLGSASIYS
jgi:carbon-monoxide dehydrogenase medium subunit